VNLPNVIKTPAGASSSAAGVISLIFNVVIPPVWPWWSHQSTTWRGAVVSVLIFAGAYLGTWLKVVKAKCQKVSLELTSGFLPTVQNVQSVPVPAGEAHLQAGS
jgi:hypothetical protein